MVALVADGVRPEFGAWEPVRFLACVGVHADLLELAVNDRAIVLCLAEIEPPAATVSQPGHSDRVNPLAIAAVAEVTRLACEAGNALYAHFRRPAGRASSRKWMTRLESGDAPAIGELYLSPGEPLSGLLIAAGFATRRPDDGPYALRPINDRIRAARAAQCRSLLRRGDDGRVYR